MRGTGIRRKADVGTPDADRSILTESSYAKGLKILRKRDPDLRKVIAEHGNPPMWDREPGFPALLRIMLEQQVSLASAKAAYDKTVAASPRLDPRQFLTFSDSTLKGFGFSRQKTGYGRNIAEAILSGNLRLDRFVTMGTPAIREELMKIKGIGSWSADIYILMALRRRDAWPSGDLALAAGIQELKRLPRRPSPEKLEHLSLSWRPWRSIAARIIWHYYLNNR